MMKKIGTPQFSNEQDLERALSTPPPAVVESLSRLQGDLLILGAGGKMGPTLAMMAKRALDEAGCNNQVIAVSRFSDASAAKSLQKAGVKIIQANLLDRNAIGNLPDAPNIVFMAGQKFGSREGFDLTWAINTYVPCLAAERFAQSRFVAFSTGNVYSFVPVTSRGSVETDAVQPIGEYAQSCVGRERLLHYFSSHHHTPMTIFRLNYAVEMRYGVILDIAQRVLSKSEINLSMGYVNVIWQGDANAYALQAFALCQSPPCILNCTGSEVLSVRTLAEQFGARFHKRPRFSGKENPTALLSDSSRCTQLLGPPQVGIEEILDWTADWLQRDQPVWNKPTQFEKRDGVFS
ncbi:MAG: NAD(P)-dependent oxidoreductase [bacterium]|jgi:nucleoside-diphosphate-sugar epimerase|nr:NAD(P)-dependent oxidoreductase [bacterium]